MLVKGDPGTESMVAGINQDCRNLKQEATTTTFLGAKRNDGWCFGCPLTSHGEDIDNDIYHYIRR